VGFPVHEETAQRGNPALHFRPEGFEILHRFREVYLNAAGLVHAHIRLHQVILKIGRFWERFSP
jgi:hypothetical protein